MVVMSMYVVSLDYLCLWQVQVSVYYVPNLYLSVADITHPDLFVCSSRTWIRFNFDEEHCQPSSGSAWPGCPKMVIGPPLLGAGRVDTICTGLARPL